MNPDDIVNMTKTLQRLREKKSDSGLSLVEMVVAIVVLGILAVAAYPLMYHALEAVSLNNITTVATVKAQDLMEQIREDPTCANINHLASEGDTYADRRGIYYRIAIAVPNGCTEATAVAVNFVGTRSSDGAKLFSQKTQVLVPPLSGDFTTNN